MNDQCFCDNVPKVWRLTGVTRTLRLRIFNPDATPCDLTGRDVVVTVSRDNSEFVYVPGFVVEGDNHNVIKFSWPADKQGAGDYTITETATDGSGNVDRVNWHGPTGIRLVDYSYMVKGSDAAGVESDSEVGLEGTYTMNGTGMSAYDEWLAEGHTGTAEDFIVWLRQPATDAASAAEAQMGQIQERADADHTRSGNDHTTAGQDHTRAGNDHTTATDDHRIAAADHSTATDDHTLAASDHGTAAEDHRVAGIDHGTAADDHTRAGNDHQTASDDHTQAGSDHTRAGEDHTRAGDDHQTASSDHTRAGEDHTTASNDHTRAGQDHTQAGNDHTRAEADHGIAADDHTQATADHAVMAGYDTRLTNVEGEVTQLGQEVEEASTGIHLIKEDEFSELTHYKDGYQLLASYPSYGKTLDNVSTTSGANYRNVRIPVEGYYAARYNAYGSSYSYGCLLVDANDVVVGALSRPTAQLNPVVFFIPTRAKYLIYSYNISTEYSRDVELFKKESVSEIDELKIETVGNTLVYKEMELLKRYDFMSYGAVIPVIGQTISLSSFSASDAGEMVKRNVLMSLDGISSFRAWQGKSTTGRGSAVLDENMVITRVITNPNTAQYFDFTVAEGDRYLLFSFNPPPDDKDEVFLNAVGGLNERVTTLESKIEEVGGSGSSSITGLIPKLYKGKTSQSGATVADEYNLTTETIFGDFYLKLSDGFKVLEASLFDREGNIVSFQIVHPDVFHSGMRASREFFSTGNTVPEYGYRLVICKNDNSAIADAEKPVINFVSLSDAGLHRWIPSDLVNYDVALRRLNYVQHLRWTPLAKVPNSYSTNVANDHFCLPGQVQIGVPYSDVAQTRKYIPNDVSIRTFMTAVKNRRSLLYTEELQNNVSKYGMTYDSGNRRSYYGSACSVLTSWIMRLKTTWLTSSIPTIPGISEVTLVTASDIRPLDLYLKSGHVCIITDVLLDEFDCLKYIVLAEMATPYPYRTIYTPEQFMSRFTSDSAAIYRWTNWSTIVEPEETELVQYRLGDTLQDVPYNEDIMCFAGDYACFAEGDTIYLNARRNTIYTGVELYKDDVLLQTIDITGLSADTIVTPNTEDWVAVNLTALNLAHGKYKARMTDGMNTTDYTFFEVVGLTLSAVVSGANIVVTFASTGTPQTIEQVQTSGFEYKIKTLSTEEIAAGTITLPWAYQSYYPMLYLIAKGDYGTAVKRISFPQ